ncbi:hypothetical protein F4774DRAFT_60156 [Daldinia eschscholtzii]|nr:hypothetical protein F4774DRAFT_60156 [Daldinia eschscholtzii]
MVDLLLIMHRVICRQPRQLQGEFSVFPSLPLELQCMIWEYTLPPPAIRLTAESSQALLQLPRPPPGHGYGNISEIRTVPRQSWSDIVALQVCRQSRMVALMHFFPLPPPGPSNIMRPIHNWISARDIVDIGTLNSLDGSLVRKSDPQGLVAQLTQLRVWTQPPNRNRIDQTRFLFDMATRRLSIAVGRNPASVRPELSLYPRLEDTFVIRASVIEEWVFGSSIAIGRVPASLQRFLEQDPEEWKRYNAATLIGGRWLNARYGVAGLCSNPSEILHVWVWLMHRLASVEPRHCPPVTDAVFILGMFMTIMDGGRCPGCDRRIMPRILGLFGGLPLGRIDLLFLIRETPTPSAYDNVMRLITM